MLKFLKKNINSKILNAETWLEVSNNYTMMN